MTDLAALKRRKDRQPDAVTGAHEAAEAHIDAMLGDADAEDAEKTYRQRGAYQGPGRTARPGRIEPGDVDRGYIEDGHAAPSPQHGAPRQPVIPLLPGTLEPISLSPQVRVGGYPGPIAETAAAHAARALGIPSTTDGGVR
ncbi:MAG: hypothetical protein ACYCVZ_16005 [Streptosporangiaceae bacterium]